MVTVAALCKDELGRFLPSWLDAVKNVADRIVVVDNGSTDGSYEYLLDHGCEVERELTPMMGNEWLLRSKLWEKSVPGSEWIVHIDTDQCPAGDFRPFLGFNRASFVVYDLWDADHYREGEHWTGHNRWFWPAINVKDFQTHEWRFKQRGWHSGHLPANFDDVGEDCVLVPKECGLLHYAFSSPDLRRDAFKKYVRLYPWLDAVEKQHVQTIMDGSPNLIELPFEPRWRLRREARV